MQLLMALLSVLPAFLDSAPTGTTAFRMQSGSLSWVTDLDYHPDHGLVVLDGLEHRLHLWDTNGKYLKSFGKQGEGPGEFQRPARVFSTDTTLYLLTYQRRIYQYDRNGVHQKTLNVHSAPFDIQSMGVTKDGVIILSGRHYDFKTNRSKMMFGRLNKDGTYRDTIKEFADIGILKVNSPNGFDADIIAYAPQTGIQADPDGTLYIGYGSTPEITRLDANGAPGETFQFPLRTAPPSDEERKRFEELSFYVGAGRYAKLSDFKSISVKWKHNKGYFTDFALRSPDQVVFNLTPMGQIPLALATGHHWGWLTRTGTNAKTANKKSYTYTEDNILFLKRGRTFMTHQFTDENLEVRIIDNI